MRTRLAHLRSAVPTPPCDPNEGLKHRHVAVCTKGGHHGKHGQKRRFIRSTGSTWTRKWVMTCHDPTKTGASAHLLSVLQETPGYSRYSGFTQHGLTKRLKRSLPHPV